MDPLTYRRLTLCLSLMVAVIDMRYFYGLSHWHKAWKHWSFILTTLYLFFAGQFFLHASAESTVVEILRVTALGCTMSVNAGYWLVLFPMRVRNCNLSLAKLPAVSVAKHGGSLLWLIGEAFITTCSDNSGLAIQLHWPSMTCSHMLVLLSVSGAYILFSIYHHKTTGEWVYGNFFQLWWVRLSFMTTPVVLYWLSVSGMSKLLNTSILSCHEASWWFPFAVLLATPLHFTVKALVQGCNRSADKGE